MAIDTSTAPAIQRGMGTPERPVIGELWRRDPKADSPILREAGNCEPNHLHIDFRRYYDEDYFRREVEHLWPKTWLFAGRDEDIPAVGDRMPLDVGPLSFFIVRSGDDRFQAFRNSCRHRGTALCSKRESASSIRCPYHAWEWHLDGRLKTIPSHWDFPSVSRINGSLDEVRLERWGGNLFINADPAAPSLYDALQIIPEHFRDFRLEDRYTAARFRKHVRANWKIAQEAFMESYHLYATHPEAVPFTADAQAQYDIWQCAAGTVGRNAAPGTIPSIHAGPEATVFNAAEAYARSIRDWLYPDVTLPELDPAGDLRAQVAGWHRQAQLQIYGQVADVPNALFTDSPLYFLFPHSTFWLSESVPFTYQFTPHPTNPRESYFEVRLMRPCAKGQSRPPSAPVVEVGPDESVFAKAPAFGFLGFVFDQDMSNMPLIQRGVRATDPERHHSRLGRYQELLVQHWNLLIDGYVGT